MQHLCQKQCNGLNNDDSSWRAPLEADAIFSPTRPHTQSALKIGMRGTFCARPMLFFKNKVVLALNAFLPSNILLIVWH